MDKEREEPMDEAPDAGSAPAGGAALEGTAVSESVAGESGTMESVTAGPEQAGPHEHRRHRIADRIMRAGEAANRFFGDAQHGDMDAPVVHKHDEFEKASEEDLAHFEVETDDDGRHYAVRKEQEDDVL